LSPEEWAHKIGELIGRQWDELNALSDECEKESGWRLAEDFSGEFWLEKRMDDDKHEMIHITW
jgi:hypothetical protein